jgi:hypothetical protein
MSAVLSLSVRLFVCGVLLLLLGCCLYRYVRSLLVDHTYAEECIARWQKRASSSKSPVYFDAPAPDVYLTVIYHIGARLDVTRERVRFICEYLAAKLGDRRFEILCFISPECPEYLAQAAPLRQQFPQIVPIGASEAPLTARSFTCAALKARGAYVVEEALLEAELERLPARADPAYLSFVDPRPEPPGVAGADALVLVAAAKPAALALLRAVHVEEFGLAAEMRMIAREKRLEVNVHARRLRAWNHAAAYWIAQRVAASVVPLMYAWGIWTVR